VSPLSEPAPRDPGVRSHTWLEGLVASAVPFLLAVNIALPQGFKVGYLLALLLLPVWLPVLKHYRSARLLVALGVAAIAVGALLTGFARIDHPTSQSLLVVNSVMLLGLIAGIGALLWSRHILGSPTVAVWFGMGMVVGIPFGSGLSSENVWRFGLSLPLTVMFLALAWKAKSRVLELAAIAVLGGVSALNDARSGSAMLLMAASLVVWQLRPTGGGRRGSTIRTLLGFAVLGSVVYTAAQAVILGGLLGENTRERTQAQIDTSGSLILGGRPEAGATLELILQQPFGYGSGTMPTLSDILVAKTGMSLIGYQPNNGYVERYMFGTGFEVHSVLGDLWIIFGLGGAALAVLFLILTFRSLAAALARRAASALLIWLAIRMVWNLLFSPLDSSVLLIMLFLAIAFVPVGSATGNATAPLASGPRHLESPKVTA
jgi:hypothetical protein